MLAFTTFMASPLGALAKLVLEGILIIAVLGGLYWLITSKASENQALKDQAAILTQVTKNQDVFIKKTEELQTLQQTTASELAQKIQEVKDSNAEIKAYLDNPATVKDDRPSSEILKRTMQSISGEK
jgi:hypothetical protein